MRTWSKNGQKTNSRAPSYVEPHERGRIRFRGYSAKPARIAGTAYMTRNERSREELLLDWHLGQLDDNNRSWIEAELLRDADLRAKSDRLGNLLRPLDYWTIAPSPSNLVDNVLRFIRESTEPTTGEPLSSASVVERSGYRRPPFLALREFIAVAACIVLLVSVGVPGLANLRERARWNTCASNLGAVFRGTTLYQQASGGSLPYAGSLRNASWLPGGDASLPYESNSRHVYLLAKLNYGPEPRHFVCPSYSRGQPMQLDKLAFLNDFARVVNCTYDSLNMGGTNPNLRPRRAIAYLSDANPLFVGGHFNASLDPNRTNSPIHRGKGQNVLLLNGTVVRMTSPIYGDHHDNLWLAGNIRRYCGTETPTDPDDAFLIPGYPVTDLANRDRPLW